MLPLRRLACFSIRRDYSASVSSAYCYSGASRTASRITGTAHRTITASLGNSSIRYFTASPGPRSDNMSAEDACREMEAAGVHKKGEPTAAAAPEQEQQKELPKLSAAEFRVYNRMAEHMDMFVRYLALETGYFASQQLTTSFLSHTAQQLPPNLEPPPRRLHLGQKTPRHDAALLPASRRRLRAPPHHPPHDRRAAHISRIGEEDACICQRARAARAAQANP